MDERTLVETLTRIRGTSLPDAGMGPGDDDAAVVPMGAFDLVVTTDLIAEGIHFHAASDPGMVGRFLASVNLSDLAAMGADPVGLLTAYGVPDQEHAERMEAFHEGAVRQAEAYGCPILGGDTKDARSFHATGTALGTLPAGSAVRRGGAQVGDLLVLTGPIGGVGAALRAFDRGRIEANEWDPEVLGVEPRMAAGRTLREMGAHAMTDLSDGLARAATLISAASGVGLRVDAERLVVADRVQDEFPGKGPDDPGWRQAVLGTGGEYELLAVVPEEAYVAIEAALRETVGLVAARVGHVVEGEGALLFRDDDTWDLAEMGWRHLAGHRAISDPDRSV